MQLDAMFLQLGIAGAMLLVMYRLAIRWMANERERQQSESRADADRAISEAKAEAERTRTIQDGFRADIEAHQAISINMQWLANQFSRVEGKLDTILDLTPVRDHFAIPPMRVTRMPSEPKVIVGGDDTQTPVERPTPPPSPKQTPTRGIPSVGGEYSRTTKPKR